MAKVCLWNAMCLAILIKRYISFDSSPEIQENLAVGTCQKQRQKHKSSSDRKFAIFISFFLVFFLFYGVGGDIGDPQWG